MLSTELRYFYTSVTCVHHLLLHALHLVTQHYGIASSRLRLQVLQHRTAFTLFYAEYYESFRLQSLHSIGCPFKISPFHRVFRPQSRLAGPLSALMNAPAEAFEATVSYIRICGLGSVFIIAYNLIGSIFRGIGDSKTPLVTVLIACVCNIAGDLLLVAVFHMGTAGAAIATVAAQALSVGISLLMLRKKPLPFSFSRADLRFQGSIVRRVTILGLPIALQDLLVGISFLVLLAIVNDLGLTPSAGVGVAERVCGFIMLIPSAFMQAMAAFVAQNFGAGQYDRAKKALAYAIGVSSLLAVGMFALSFWRGDLLSGIFSKDPAVIEASADYLRAYAIDCLLTCFLFCFIGFFNGIGMTRFVMIQGIVGSFLVRVPVAFLMSREVPVSMFHVGLATPCSTVLQVLLCLGCFRVANRRYGEKQLTAKRP